VTHRIVLATHNPHKVEEFQAIVAATRPDIQVISYDGPEPVEDGVTFAENALIKAEAAAGETGRPAIADDSGIAAHALGGILELVERDLVDDRGEQIDLELVREPH